MSWNQEANSAKLQAMQQTPGLGSNLMIPPSPTLKQNLESQLRSDKANVVCLKELIQLLQNNPEVDRILELMGISY